MCRSGTKEPQPCGEKKKNQKKTLGMACFTHSTVTGFFLNAVIRETLGVHEVEMSICKYPVNNIQVGNNIAN